MDALCLCPPSPLSTIHSPLFLYIARMQINREKTWEAELAESFRDSAELCRYLHLPDSVRQNDLAATAEYPLLVPRSFANRMEPGNPNDPLLLQVLPQRQETESVDGFTTDPVGEHQHWAGTPCRVLQKYPGRALILAADACAVHCRFCFRRYFSGKKADVSLETIRNSPEIHEVIFSGGDPLLLPDMELRELLYYTAMIPHVKRVRIHSRLPIAIPSRITSELIDTLSRFSPIYLVLHVNHPNELNDEVLERIESLVDVGVPVMSQTVLLRGINDNLETLRNLFEKLIDSRIIPYYLHQLDRVSGAAHFEVASDVGRALIAELRNLLPGYAVPQYVQEIVGAPGKRPL